MLLRCLHTLRLLHHKNFEIQSISIHPNFMSFYFFNYAFGVRYNEGKQMQEKPQQRVTERIQVVWLYCEFSFNEKKLTDALLKHRRHIRFLF